MSMINFLAQDDYNFNPGAEYGSGVFSLRACCFQKILSQTQDKLTPYRPQYELYWSFS